MALVLGARFEVLASKFHLQQFNNWQCVFCGLEFTVWVQGLACGV